MSVAVNNNNWKPLKKCTTILEWRAIQTLKNHIVAGIKYPFLAKDARGRWLGSDGEFVKWQMKNKK